MKYIKKFQINEKIYEYDKIKNDQPFFISDIFKTGKIKYMSMCKMLNIENNYINWEEYDYDYLEKGYQVINRSININDFDKYYSVVNTFKTFKEMKNEYEIITTGNKYNL